MFYKIKMFNKNRLSNNSTRMNHKSRVTATDSWRTTASRSIPGSTSNWKTSIWRSVEYRTNELGFIWVIYYDWILDSLRDLTIDDIYASMFGRPSVFKKRNVPLNFFEEESFEPFLYYWDDLYFNGAFKNIIILYFLHPLKSKSSK